MGRSLLNAAGVAACSVAIVGGLGCSSPKVGSLPETAQGAAPSTPWVVEYSSAQEALLAPLGTPIQVPAGRVFPDLMRFGYADDRPLEDPADTFRFTRLVAEVLEQSPRYYAFDIANSDLANPTLQYGPSPALEADPWQITKRAGDGIGTLTAEEVPDAAQAAFEEGQAAIAAGNREDAIAAFRRAVDASPTTVALTFALGELLAETGSEEAIQWYERTTALDPTFASAHRALALILLERGNVDRARSELIAALAYHPPSVLAGELAKSFVPEGISEELRPPPFGIFLDVDAAGAVRVAAEDSPAAQMYAGCRAVMRFEPELRSAILEQPAGTPYYLTVTEEVICLESAIGAYLFDLGQAAQSGEEVAEDPRMEALIRIAKREGLTGYVMFEVLGRHQPQRSRTAPPRVHSATVGYIDRYVLGHPKELPPGHYTARLESH